MAAIIFLLVLKFLVFIHELGHYLAARWAKVKIEEFGLGIPPRALTLFKRGETIFSLNWFPIGGFVKMQGEEERSSEKTEQPADQEGPFYSKNRWQRLVITLAGVTVNFLFALIAFSVVYTISGIPTAIDEARVGAVVEDSPAAKANIPADVNLIALKNLDGEVFPIRNNQEAIELIRDYRGQEVVLVTTGPCDASGCQELAQEFEVYLRTADETPADQGSLGIVFAPGQLVHYPWYEMPFRGTLVGVEQALTMGSLIITALFDMIRGIFQSSQLPSDIAGPIGIVHQAGQIGLFEQGFLMILNFAGLLSINLAIINLLPIPALDGGRAIFILIEPLIGKKRLQLFESYANQAGMLFLLSLIALISIRDVWRIFDS